MSLFGSLKHENELIVDRPGRFPFRWPGHVADTFVLRWHARRLRAALDINDGKNCIALVFDPRFWPNIVALRPRYVVYFQYDAFSRMPGWTAGIAENEKQIVRRADCIVSATRYMAATLPGDGPTRAMILPNGVHLKAFETADTLPCPPNLARIPHPRIGHIGTISQRLDFDLMLALATARAEWQFVLIGPIQREGGRGDLDEPATDGKWRKLRLLPNVHYLPPIKHEDVPAYMAHMDINAMWYQTPSHGWWSFGSPIKLYENLAVGKPIVSTGIPVLWDYKEVVEIATTTGEWIAAITRALENGGTGTPSQRREVAAKNTWEIRAGKLEECLNRMVEHT